MSRGIQRERDLVNLLREDGFWAIRSPASKGDVDVVAMRHLYSDETQAMFIEVKSTARGPYAGFGPGDRAGLSAAAKMAGAEAWLVWWPPRKKPQWIAEKDWPESHTDASCQVS